MADRHIPPVDTSSGEGADSAKDISAGEGHVVQLKIVPKHKTLTLIVNTRKAGFLLRNGKYATQKNLGAAQTAVDFLDAFSFPSCDEENTFWISQLKEKDFPIQSELVNHLTLVIPPGIHYPFELSNEFSSRCFEKFSIFWVNEQGAPFADEDHSKYEKFQFENYTDRFRFKELEVFNHPRGYGAYAEIPEFPKKWEEDDGSLSIIPFVLNEADSKVTINSSGITHLRLVLRGQPSDFKEFKWNNTKIKVLTFVLNRQKYGNPFANDAIRASFKINSSNSVINPTFDSDVNDARSYVRFEIERWNGTCVFLKIPKKQINQISPSPSTSATPTPSPSIKATPKPSPSISATPKPQNSKMSCFSVSYPDD